MEVTDYHTLTCNHRKLKFSGVGIRKRFFGTVKNISCASDRPGAKYQPRPGDHFSAGAGVLVSAGQSKAALI